jgi:hypothetical protein
VYHTVCWMLPGGAYMRLACAPDDEIADALLAYANPTPPFASKGRLRRCTVEGSIPNLAAVLRTLNPPARAARIRFCRSEATGDDQAVFPRP